MKKKPKKFTRKEILHMPQGAEMDAATERFVRLSPNAQWSPSSKIGDAMVLLLSRQRDGWEWDVWRFNSTNIYSATIRKHGRGSFCAETDSLCLSICRAVLLTEAEER